MMGGNVLRLRTTAWSKEKIKATGLALNLLLLFFSRSLFVICSQELFSAFLSFAQKLHYHTRDRGGLSLV